MSEDVHFRICERLGVKLPRATRLVVIVKGTKAHAEAVREECRAFLESYRRKLVTEGIGKAAYRGGA